MKKIILSLWVILLYNYSEGLYFQVFIGDTPMWTTSRKDAFKYESTDKISIDRIRLENMGYSLIIVME